MFPIRNKRSLVQAVGIIILVMITLIWLKPSIVQNSKSKSHGHNFNSESLKTKPRYYDACFDANLKYAIEDLEENIHTWSQAIDRKCQILWGKFQDMFSVSVRRGSLHLPPKFEVKVSKWLGNNPHLLKQVHNQTVYHVRNLYNLEHTVYNPLRSKRPGSVSDINPRDYVNQLAASSNDSCDFCNYKEMTAQDVFERIEGKLSVSAANTFKLDQWHGLFLTKKHNPLALQEEDVLDLFNTSLKWFQKVHSIDPEARYPIIIWDNLPHAGASQLHPHLHGMLDTMQYYGAAYIQYEGARKYNQYTSNKYWQDFVEIHTALGLTVSLGSAVALAPLTSKKDHEMFLLSDEPSIDLFRLLFNVIKTYNDKLQIYCFSTGISLPALAGSQTQQPAIVRIGTRGDCSSIRSDISSLELYSVNNVNVDPYSIVAKLRETVNLYLENPTEKHASMISWR